MNTHDMFDRNQNEKEEEKHKEKIIDVGEKSVRIRKHGKENTVRTTINQSMYTCVYT